MTYLVSGMLGVKGRHLEEIHIAAHVHDIGKIGIPDKILNKILNKNGKLLSSEWECIKQHPVIGYNILNKSSKLHNISKIVLHHHERWDGRGYPDGLKQTEIPLGSRIIAVCDSIDAMISKRPYSGSLGIDDCRKEIENNIGIMFDPIIGKVVLENWLKVIEIYMNNNKLPLHA